MHHDVLSSACVDIDGVLCVDPTEQENDDGQGYLNFLANAKPLWSPTKRIGTLVTSRLEKYRPETEKWLTKFGIEYDNLIMLDLPDAETRRKLGAHGAFKGSYYRQSNSLLFIESEIEQAAKIAQISGKDVLCIADQQIYRPGALSLVAGAQRLRRSRRIRNVVRSFTSDSLRTRLKSVLSVK